MLDEPTPAEADPIGAWYCFEKGAAKAGGGEDWADVWRRGCFGWEYKGKGKGKDFQVAFKQLQIYTPALEYPPLLIVSDIETIVIHTAFTGTVPEVQILTLEDLRDAAKRRLLKWAFSDPERLKPGKTTAALTEDAAGHFGGLAQALRARGHDPQGVGRFCIRLLFCLFAEDIDLLRGEMFTRLLAAGEKDPASLDAMLGDLFGAMAKGGRLGIESVDWFNGGLFDSRETLPLEPEDVRVLRDLARVTVWIGEIQWMLAHGFALATNPILKPLNTIEQRDAVLNADGSELDASTCPDHQLIAVCRADDTTFGILHSRFHELWSLRMGTSLEDRPRYTPTTTFETFPFPQGLTPADTLGVGASRPQRGQDGPAPILPPVAPERRAAALAIAEAAHRLNALREAWLNQPEWVDRVPEVVPGYPDRMIPRPEHATEIKKRTLTNLYNQRPSWLDLAHKALDAAVAAAYGWDDYGRDMSDEEILRRLLALNLERSGRDG